MLYLKIIYYIIYNIMSNNIENSQESEESNQEQENNLEISKKYITFNPKTNNDKFKVDCWNNEKNGSLTPRDVNKKSHKFCWFICDVCSHNFREKIINIMQKNLWCPYCDGRKLCDDDDCDICYQNSFASAG